MRSEFEKAFPIHAHWIEFDEKTNKYYCPYVADAKASEYQSMWKVWQHQQSKVDELQKRVDAAHDTLTELKEKSEALHHRWHILNDSVALAEAEMIDMCVKELEQALKGGNHEAN